jgi:DNA-binding XRE family transcriptional regulator
MKRTMDFSAIERAGLTQVEFAKLVNVTRVTVNHWVNGGMPANFLRRAVEGYLADLELAIEKDLLPWGLADIPPSMGESARRWEVIDEVLTRVAIEGDGK